MSFLLISTKESGRFTLTAWHVPGQKGMFRGLHQWRQSPLALREAVASRTFPQLQSAPLKQYNHIQAFYPRGPSTNSGTTGSELNLDIPDSASLKKNTKREQFGAFQSQAAGQPDIRRFLLRFQDFCSPPICSARDKIFHFQKKWEPSFKWESVAFGSWTQTTSAKFIFWIPGWMRACNRHRKI